MGSMMNGDMTCSAPMMIGMGLVALLLIATLVLIAAAAVKYLRSARPAGDRGRSFDRPAEDR